MTADELRERTEAFAVAVVNFSKLLSESIAGRRIAHQLIDSATSVAANYRAACRSFTKPLFVAKLATVLEEADESCFWLRLVLKSKLVGREQTEPLLAEANELTAIFACSLRTARGRKPATKTPN